MVLTLDEIKEREKVIDEMGQDIVEDGVFNSIFGYSKKRYLELKEKNNIKNK